MARSKTVIKNRMTNKGTKTTKVTQNKVTRNDLRQLHEKNRHTERMAVEETRRQAINNKDYQKAKTARTAIAGAEAAGSIAAPASAALVNTNAYSSGGFNYNTVGDKENNNNNPSEDESSNSNNSVIWG